WIVIQQRIDGSLSFDQNWTTYKAGFGAYNANFWLGLEKIYQLTNSASYRLRFEVLSNGYWTSDEYDNFKIDSESLQYAIHVSGYSGDNLDILNQPPHGASLVSHNGMKFSTPDRDNTPNRRNCGLSYHAGNWFNYCYAQNLNG
ncbi:hypothetical protein HELRODRAFT_144825, partial [Helobdella robusta]|uniref:Fibrinogen C-terminal domain-containing protein n=1 Tax=Helobdella robusta TaxID=6412 RepID=T1EJG7_HELRO